MQWDRFFEDLEDQVDSEWEAERAALDTEAERLRFAQTTLRERLASSARAAGGGAVSLELAGGDVVAGDVAGVGADWIAVTGSGALGVVLVPFTAVVALGMPHAEILRTARGGERHGRLAERMTLGFVLRDLVRRRAPVTVHTTTGRAYAGTIDRAAADHLDLALHDPGAPRRAALVAGHRIIPFPAVASVRLDALAPS